MHSRPLTVLIADDNVDAATTLGDLFEILGHKVVVVHDGAAAVEAAAKIRPQLAILDIGMPRMSGYDAAPEVRRVSPSTMIVACTGWGADRDRARARQSGFDHHLLKPVALDALEPLLVEAQSRAA